MRLIILIYLILFFSNVLSFGQDTVSQEFTMEFSNPDQKGKLVINLNEGSIQIKGSPSAKQIQIKANISSKSEKMEENEGMKQIKDYNIEMEIEEKNNVINILSHSKKVINLEITVPKLIDLETNLYVKSEGVSIENVEGNISANVDEGDVLLKDVIGSASVVIYSGSQGNIVANFLEVFPNTPMAFSTRRGDIDVTFPDDIGFKGHISSDKGKVYSDFDMVAERIQPKKINKNKIIISGLIRYKINQGGAEMIFKSIYGNIYIRK